MFNVFDGHDLNFILIFAAFRALVYMYITLDRQLAVYFRCNDIITATFLLLQLWTVALKMLDRTTVITAATCTDQSASYQTKSLQSLP